MHKINTLKYLTGYSATVTDQVHRLLDNDNLAELLLKKYPVTHDIKTDKALYIYVVNMKNQFLRQSSPLSKVVYDDKIDVLHQALGLHSFVSRVQGNNLKSKNEIRIGSIFKNGPLDFLRMIVVAVPNLNNDAKILWQEAKELNLIFNKIYQKPTFFLPENP